mmetsp:Transcript_15265/g.31162  ORF Transcript_15265/g.31162 Transcript_15265/m.31162 type:complete len:655 (+) Transcript_15265:70-2034(+)
MSSKRPNTMAPPTSPLPLLPTVLHLLLLLLQPPQTQADCAPCEITPTGFALRPGTGCREYVNCQDGVEVQSQACNGGLVFDLNIKGCNWDYMVTCPSDEEILAACPDRAEETTEESGGGGDGGGGDNAQEGQGDEGQDDQESDSGGGGDPKCEVPLCEMGFSGMTTVPFSECVDYVMCSNGVPGTVMSCPYGQKYDVRIQACNIVAQVTNCAPDPTCPPTKSPTTSPASDPTLAPTSVETSEPTRSAVETTPMAGGGSGAGGNTAAAVDPSVQARMDVELLEGLYVMDAHIAANKILIARELLTSPNVGRVRTSSSALFQSGTPFTYTGFKDSLHTMITTPIDGQSFYIGESQSLNGRVYGLVNIAAFLAMSVADSIHSGSCDEINNDIVGGYLPISNACGQNGLDYQSMTCPNQDDQEKYACPVDTNMVAYASIALGSAGRDQGEKPPMPFYCGPAQSYGGFTGHWDYISETENRDRPIENKLGRQDVEGCCWWGRGAIHTRGPCAYGKLNYYLGKRAADEGRPSMYPEIDFCIDPSAICSNDKYPDLKWIAGMFRWITEIQSYETEEFRYMDGLKGFVDGGLNDWGFMHAVAGIVTQGCHSPPCMEGAEFNGVERKAIFVKTLKLFGLVVNDKAATGRRLEGENEIAEDVIV